MNMLLRKELTSFNKASLKTKMLSNQSLTTLILLNQKDQNILTFKSHKKETKRIKNWT